MKNIPLFVGVFIVFCCLPLAMFAQEKKQEEGIKIEVETRIKPTEVPQKALAFVDSLLGSGIKIRWYKEEAQTTTTIEAKAKKNKQKYSIEFNTTGQIEDVEVQISQLPKRIREKIYRNLSEKSSKSFKIRKIQVQYSGGESVILSYLLKNNNRLKSLKIQYELVVRIKKEGKQQLKEYLFDEEGNLLKSATIQFRNTDNLEF